MIDVVMPQMGESIVEGTLTKWLKKPGDRVERDEPLFEISTDKVDTEIPAPAAGTMADILITEGTTVGINTIVCRIDETGGAAKAAPAPPPAADVAPPPPPVPAPAPAPAAPAPPPPAAAAPPPTPAPAPPPPAVSEEEDPQGPLSPLVRKMAREFNIDLKQVRGSGPGGRITKQDVENYMAAQGARTMAAPTPAPPPAAVAPPPPAPPPAAPAPAPPPPAAAAAAVTPIPRIDGPKTRVEAMSTMRQKIAEHMVFSEHTSVHVTTVHKVDMTKVAKTRERSKAVFQERYGFSLTFLPFVTRAATVALRQFPIVNASIQDKSIIYHNEVNIGIAVALEGGNGLIVPVIRNADEKNVPGLQRSIVDLSTRARSKQLKPDEVTGGTFSITNFGSFGSVFATPVINQPQVAILGVGTIEKQPVVVEGDAIAIRSICYLALTFDHRLIDGALADQYTGRVKQILETWSEEVI
jgi:pyruvate dehydrogenase E2 component (dihydrolipoamide acetyltransferase)